MLHPRRAIDRLLSGTLHEALEKVLRAHLRRCDACRAHHDQGRLLLRALSGDATRPTGSERQALRERVLAASQGPEKCVRPPRSAPLSLLWQWPLVAPRVALAAVGLLLVAFGTLLSLQQTPVLVARVEAGAGVAIAGRAGAAEHPVFTGDEVVVGEGGMATLRLQVDGLVRAFPGTRLTLRDAGKTLRLREGRIWCDLGPQGDRPFKVITHDAIVTVVGTSFVVERSDGRATEVRVMEGTVRVTERDGHGKAVLVKAGTRSWVQRGAAPKAPVAYDAAADRGAWKKLWRDLVDALNRGLRRVRRYLE